MEINGSLMRIQIMEFLISWKLSSRQSILLDNHGKIQNYNLKLYPKI